MFRLLGIQFCNILSNIQSNYKNGTQNMHNIANNWKYHYLTLFEKITVIKTYMLPQLTHIATVIPNLSAKQIQEIEKIWEEFIRSGCPTVANVKSFYVPSKEGGFGIH